MTWFHWIVEQLMRVRAKKEGDAVSARVRAEGQPMGGGRDALAAAEYKQLEADCAARTEAHQKLN